MRWGVLGCGKIAADFCNALSLSQAGQLAAVAARDVGRATVFAEKFSGATARAFGSYDELLQSSEVDAVYVATLPNTHSALAERCMRNGKPVLVEKPVTMTSAEAQALAKLSKELGVFHMAGMWTRCFPAFRRAQELVAEGVIGRVHHVSADFGYNTAGGAPANVYDDGMGIDIGIYPIQAAQAFFPNQRVDDVQATGVLRGQADWTVSASLRFRPEGEAGADPDAKAAEAGGVPHGVASVMYTGALNTPETTTIMGELGSVTLLRPAHTPTKLKLEIDRNRGEPEVSYEEFALPKSAPDVSWNYPNSEGLLYEIEAVHDAVRQGKLECPLYTHEDGIETLRIMELVRDRLGLPALES